MNASKNSAKKRPQSPKVSMERLSQNVSDILETVVYLKDHMASKDDLAELESRMASKDDLAELESRMASKDDLAELESRMASKDDLRNLATKDDLEAVKEEIIARLMPTEKAVDADAEKIINHERRITVIEKKLELAQ